MGYYQTYGSGTQKKPMKDILYMHVDVWEIDKQNLDARDPHNIIKGSWINDFNFFAPNEVFENIAHSWEEHDSMPGRITQKFSDVKKGAADIVSTGQVIAGNSTRAGSTDSAKYKMDTPLVWNGSQRREFSFPIVLLDQDEPKKITEVVTLFKKYSSAKIDEPGTTAAIKFPYIFEVEVGDLIYMDACALTGIQTTYGYPFIGGYPTKISMTLTFVDLKPLYERSFNPNVSLEGFL